MKSQSKVIIKILINMIKYFQVLEELQAKPDQEIKLLIIQEEIVEAIASKTSNLVVEQTEEKTTLEDQIDLIIIAKVGKVEVQLIKTI